MNRSALFLALVPNNLSSSVELQLLRREPRTHSGNVLTFHILACQHSVMEGDKEGKRERKDREREKRGNIRGKRREGWNGSAAPAFK